MKNCLKYLICIVFFVGCQQDVSLADTTKINGYWEIEKVVTADGEKKEYKINETLDFFQMKKNIGFRKKVTPQFDGSYLINDQQEAVRIVQKADTIFLEYSTKFNKWREQILKVSDEEFIVENPQKITYYYKRPVKFSIK